VASRFTDATKRSIVIVNLRRVQGLLLGHFSLSNLSNMGTLTVDAFKGAAYQAAGVAPPRPDPSQVQAMNQPSAAASAASAKPPAKIQIIAVPDDMRCVYTQKRQRKLTPRQ